MTDFEIFLERLHYESADNASTWDLLRLFHENDFDPALTMRVLRACRETEIRVDAAGFYRDKGDPSRKISVITDEELDKIAELVRSELEVVTIPASEQSRAALKEDLYKILQNRNESALLEEIANAYAEERPRLARDISLTGLQNYLRFKAGMSLFTIIFFSYDIQDFIANSIWAGRNSDPFFVSDVQRSISYVVK